MTNFVIGLLNAWRRMIEAMERTLVSNVAATVPWLAPIAPAYMAWNNSVTLLGWPVWVAWMVAAAVEGLGMSVVSTAFELWDWNDTKRNKEQTAPLWIAVLAVLFYLAVVVMVNVLLDLGMPAWIAKALLSLLSVPAVVTLALRSQHARRMEIKDQEREERRIERHEAREFRRQLKLSENLQKDTVVKPKEPERSVNFGRWTDWRHVPDEERLRVFQMRNDVRLVMEEYGVSERTGYNWIGKAEAQIQNAEGGMQNAEGGRQNAESSEEV